MVHARVSDKYIHFSLMYTTDHIFLVLPIKHLVDNYGEPTTPHKMATGKEPTVSNLCDVFCPCVLQKATAHVDTKVLNMRNQSQKVFKIYFLGFHNIRKGASSTYLVHINSLTQSR